MDAALVPSAHEDAVYLVVDCYGKGGCVNREAEVGKSDLETAIADFMSGQYNDPDRVIAFQHRRVAALSGSAKLDGVRSFAGTE
jgi:hypothetical protein